MTQLDILKLACEAALEERNRWYDRLQKESATPVNKVRYASAYVHYIKANKTLDEITALVFAEGQKAQ